MMTLRAAISRASTLPGLLQQSSEKFLDKCLALGVFLGMKADSAPFCQFVPQLFAFQCFLGWDAPGRPSESLGGPERGVKATIERMAHALKPPFFVGCVPSLRLKGCVGFFQWRSSPHRTLALHIFALSIWGRSCNCDVLSFPSGGLF